MRLTMRAEAQVAADFFAKLMTRRVDESVLATFRANFVSLFVEKFEKSWPNADEALRGSVCLRVWGGSSSGCA